MASTASAYLTGFGRYLPGDPVDNDGIVSRLGGDDAVTARIRRRVLDANGIRQRYYALDEQGEPTELGDVPDERQHKGGDTERGGDERHGEGAAAHLGRVGLALRLEGPGVPATGADGVLDVTRVILERVHGFGHRTILASVGCGSR
ncbi:hypothetical protein AB0P19_14700 [Microbacterium oleivorans]|uniref:hypothetical protein n=1 Tax=Microbacterium oleivorans TaxID=273677 RepID=UPI0033F5DED4